MTQTDSTLIELCEARKVNHEKVLRIFQTLDATLLIEEKYFLDSNKYFTINVLQSNISVDSFETIHQVTLPQSLVTTKDYEMVISHKVDGEIPDTGTVLIICYYNNAADNNMPIARLTHYISTGSIRYEYITQPQSVSFTRE